jgi:hypothetical protein
VSLSLPFLISISSRTGGESLPYLNLPICPIDFDTKQRDLYRNLNLSAKRARQLAHDLVKAGLVAERQFQGAEWYVAMEFLDPINE